MKGLPVDGFIFLRDLFIGHNISRGSIERYPEMSKHKKRHVKLTDIDVTFEVKVDPVTLHNYQMIWEIVLQSQDETVVSKSIGILVNLHVNLHECLSANKSAILQSLVSSIFTRFAEN